jgi:hypothetical protein
MSHPGCRHQPNKVGLSEVLAVDRRFEGPDLVSA